MEESNNSPGRRITCHGTTKHTPPLTERLRRKPGEVRIEEWRVEDLILHSSVILYLMSSFKQSYVCNVNIY